MKNSIFFLILIGAAMAVASCSKEHATRPQAPPVPMRYTSFSDSAIPFGGHAFYDLDGNGSTDIGFGTQLVGDPLSHQDKRQWYAFGTFNTFFAVSNNEEMPFLPIDHPVTPGGFPGYSWYNASSILVAQQLLSETGPPRWEGAWKDATHSFFPLQVQRGDSLYTGWAEISFRTADGRLFLHRAGLATVAGAIVRTGQ
ncbi:MAG: hypothetical protein EOO11_01375 [Chitinophagaceae bacterium]|nr:MAG: hypothetical protein EOO11_01375 [Chitinophagaceae bacterium]